MLLENGIQFTYDKITPESALSMCAFCSTESMSDSEKLIIQNALDLFMEWEKTHPVPYWEKRRFNLFVLYQPQLSLLAETSILGTTATVILLRMDKIRRLHSPVLCLAVVLEELCHAFYMVPDEHEVKELVIQILSLLVPGLRLNSLYPSMFDQEGNRRYHP